MSLNWSVGPPAYVSVRHRRAGNVESNWWVCLQVNTDGLVLRGWYTSLTLAVYGTAERAHGYDHGSPPPPPPPPPQQQSGAKRAVKQGASTDPSRPQSPPKLMHLKSLACANHHASLSQ